jgi:hypothetical protein
MPPSVVLLVPRASSVPFPTLSSPWAAWCANRATQQGVQPFPGTPSLAHGGGCFVLLVRTRSSPTQCSSTPTPSACPRRRVFSDSGLLLRWVAHLKCEPHPQEPTWTNLWCVFEGVISACKDICCCSTRLHTLARPMSELQTICHAFTTCRFGVAALPWWVSSSPSLRRASLGGWVSACKQNVRVEKWCAPNLRSAAECRFTLLPPHVICNPL